MSDKTNEEEVESESIAAAEALLSNRLVDEPTDEQVRLAAEAAHKFDAEVSEMFGKPFDPDLSSLPQWAYDTHLDKARAALTAAGVAPQAPSGSRDQQAAARLAVSDHEAFAECYDSELPLIDAVLGRISSLSSPEHPHVHDAAKIAEVLDSHQVEYGECRCGEVIDGSTIEAHQARAVIASLSEGESK